MVPRPAAEGDDTIRAFIAIELDDAARRAAADVAQTLRAGPGGDRVHWVRPETLHVTLRFLGDVAPSRVAPIVRNLREATAGLRPFRMHLSSVAVFPSPRRPRVVVLGVEPRKLLEDLAGAVERAVVKEGFESEKRRFSPHLTLGRVRGRAPSTVTFPVTVDGESLLVSEIVLFRSELKRTGAIHTPLERIAFGGSDHP